MLEYFISPAKLSGPFAPFVDERGSSTRSAPPPHTRPPLVTGLQWSDFNKPINKLTNEQTRAITILAEVKVYSLTSLCLVLHIYEVC